MCNSNYVQSTFCYLGRLLKKFADDQCSSITKCSIYHVLKMFIEPFTNGDRADIARYRSIFKF